MIHWLNLKVKQSRRATDAFHQKALNRAYMDLFLILTFFYVSYMAMLQYPNMVSNLFKAKEIRNESCAARNSTDIHK